MYETQFGLNKRPFRAQASGSDVFVGPQTAAAMAGLKKALAAPDAIVAVGGPVGVGKTTIVRRALEAIGESPVIIWVGRMQLGHDEVLELLLEEMGIEIPDGTVRRFTRFRRQLQQYAAEGSRTFVVVEDVSRIGPVALSELEALTAMDAGASEGANIVLMGDETLEDSLKSPDLARLRQRLRLRQSIAPLRGTELLGYLKHCFRLAGNEFDQIFESGSAAVLHSLSGGIPRMVNNLVESSLMSAAENKLDRVSVAQIKLVAAEEYDLSVATESTPQAEALADPVLPEPEPKPEVNAPEPEPELELQPPEPEPAATAPEPEAEPALQAPEPGLEKEPEPAAPPPIVTPEPPVVTPEPPAVEQAPAAKTSPDSDAPGEIPELIQDTLPDLKVLAPDLARTAEQQPVQNTIPQKRQQPEVRTPATDEKLEAAQVEAPEEEVPDWERDPTLAQLRPDLDALEHAMAVAEGKKAEREAKERANGEPREGVPELTLDREIQAKIDAANEKLRLEQKRRAAAEAQRLKDKGIDNRPTSVILAEARAKEAERATTPDNSVEAQFEAELPLLEDPIELDVLQAPTDTVAELPVLRDMTQPLFEPAAHREPNPEPAETATADISDTAELESIPELTLEPEQVPEMETEPAPAAEPEPVVEAEPEPVFVAESNVEPQPVIEPQPVVDPEEVEKARKADAELEQIAANLARAKTIDDCDDKMAETLFGEEFSMMAAQVAASVPADLFADDEPEEPETLIEGVEPANEEIDEPLNLELESPVEAAEPANDQIDEPLELETPIEAIEPANDEIDEPAVAGMQDFDGAAAVSVELGSEPNIHGSADTSASQRLATVRALNASALHPALDDAITPPEPPTPPVDQPKSIEEQMNTSMTQTLKTLSVRPAVKKEEPVDTDKPKRGFFSRFRR